MYFFNITLLNLIKNDNIMHFDCLDVGLCIEI